MVPLQTDKTYLLNWWFMKAVYITCCADPWSTVVTKLQEDYHVDPVYWLGYSIG